ncbi:coiled-coil domain-containing protein 187 isoform X3 [Latimeria chalumnae]|uniref:coiled-coil domain-containing protein 187 isoform X3 n=1 Tax=Latimeria chalumnae TaxID=7897 RepID=UPI00313DCD11
MTDIDIDQSHLPRVREVCEGFAVLEDGALAHFLQEQEIENYYASNIEKNQLVQKDIRIAKKLQGEENEYCRQLTEHQQRLVEERDLEYARAIQEELQLQAAEHRRREEEDGEIAKQLQEEEERQTEKPSLRSLHHGDEEDSNRVPDEGSWQWQGPSLLERGMARVEIEDHEQLLQDEELARRLQEEEEKRLVQIRSQSRQKQEEDYRAAQVAQDEEIAKYMQRQEIKAQQRAKEREMCRNSPQEDAEDDSHSMERERSWDRKNELACTHPGRLNSEGLLSPTEDWTLKQPESPNQTAGDTGTKPVFPRNVAEELDPTFQAKRRENPAEMATRASAGAVRCQSAPVDGFYDYLDDGSEAAFVLPTKRQTDKSGRQKTRDKKEGCKQQ